ncbi:hypothetical protein L2E82_11379 [Cichorium intybus]|uniref:Uncharacterized protein n=1 Tax=Cichorium intybus TaxID=13427 RepID=A0ACB9GE57_CICIN|nr:hypothetical protein L2E82_11379 [Cichorium intybus]
MRPAPAPSVTQNRKIGNFRVAKVMVLETSESDSILAAKLQTPEQFAYNIRSSQWTNDANEDELCDAFGH